MGLPTDDPAPAAMTGSAKSAQAVAAAAAAAAGLDAGLLGGYPGALAAIAETGRRLTQTELDDCRARGAAAAEQGVSLRALISLHLTVAWGLWQELPSLRQANRPATLRVMAAAVLRAADDATAALADGHERAQQMVTRLEEARRREFIDDLLSGRANIERLVERAEHFGLQLASPHTVTVVHTPQPLTDASARTRQAEAVVLQRFGNRDVLVATKEGALVCVTPASDDSSMREPAHLLQQLLGGRAGVGRPHPGPSGVVRSYEEAQEALDLTTRLGIDTPVSSAVDLLVYRVLMRDRAAIADLVAAVLQPLQRARGGATPLLDTLEAYFAAGCVAAAAARRLHIGVRTVTYRLGRVRALTGYAAADPAQRFTLEAAVLGARLLDWPRQPLPPTGI